MMIVRCAFYLYTFFACDTLTNYYTRFSFAKYYYHSLRRKLNDIAYRKMKTNGPTQPTQN